MQSSEELEYLPLQVDPRTTPQLGKREGEVLGCFLGFDQRWHGANVPNMTATSTGSTWAYRLARSRVLDRDHWTCRWCHRHIHATCRTRCDDCATVDHLQHQRDAPHLRNDPTNMIASCRWCNLTRGVGALPRPRPTRPHPGAGKSPSPNAKTRPSPGDPPPKPGKVSAVRMPSW